MGYFISQGYLAAASLHPDNPEVLKIARALNPGVDVGNTPDPVSPPSPTPTTTLADKLYPGTQASKQPNVYVQNAKGKGGGAAMASGVGGVNPNDLTLGKTTLLGA